MLVKVNHRKKPSRRHVPYDVEARMQTLIEQDLDLLPGGLLSQEAAAEVAAGFARTPIQWDAETFRGLGLDAPDQGELGRFGIPGDASYTPPPVDPAIVTPEDIAELALPVSERPRAMAAVVGGKSQEVKRDTVYDVAISSL